MGTFIQQAVGLSLNATGGRVCEVSPEFFFLVKSASWDFEEFSKFSLT